MSCTENVTWRKSVVLLSLMFFNMILYLSKCCVSVVAGSPVEWSKIFNVGLLLELMRLLGISSF